MTNTKKQAFTLVELIVVITILAILGTIAFISLGNYTSDARNSVREDAIAKIGTSIEAFLIKGQPLLSFISGTGSRVTEPSVASIAGTGSIASTDYEAGDANYSALGIKAVDFQDPQSDAAYKVGATTKVGGKYEVAATLEEGAGDRAKVLGNYSPRENVAKSGSAVAGSNNLKFKLDNNTDINFFKVGDTIGDGTATGTINAISNDGTIITTSTGITASSISLAASESAGLIGSDVEANGSATGSVVTNDSSTILPYQ